jgi:hypothetical protein
MNVSHSIRAAGALTPFGSRARLTALFVLPFALASLASCTANRSATTYTAPRTIDASQAMVMPAPGGPMIINLIEERFSDGVEQKIILATNANTSGENYLSIRLYGPMERERQGTRGLGYKDVTAVALHNEAIRAVPGVAMKTSGLFLRNTYGPFGYAFGQNSSGDSCIYGWQQLRSTENERKNFRNTGKVQIRLRLCENGASERQLLAVMYGYTVTGTFASDQWNPFGGPKEIASAVDPNGGPIYPADAELAPAIAVAPAQPVRRKTVIVQKKVEKPVIDTSAEEEDAAKRIVDVPAPGDDNALTPGDATKGGLQVPQPDCPEGNSACN